MLVFQPEPDSDLFVLVRFPLPPGPYPATPVALFVLHRQPSLVLPGEPELALLLDVRHPPRWLLRDPDVVSADGPFARVEE